MIELKIDAARMRSIGDELGASEDDLKKAYNRALAKTSRALRTQARKALREGLKLRAAAVLNARLKLVRFKPRGRGLGGALLWTGTNDLPARAFKGTPRQTATGAIVGGRSFKGAFVGVGQNSGAKIIFRRKANTRKRVKESNYAELAIHEETVSIVEEAEPILEDVYEDVATIFFKNFKSEVRARTIYNV